METSYWLDPNGAVHFVGSGIQPRHSRWIYRTVGISVDAAEDAGWHRLVASPQELFTYGRVPFTPQQEASLAVLAGELGNLIIRPWVRSMAILD